MTLQLSWRKLVPILISLAIVGLAAKTNHLATGLQVAVDPQFDRSASR